MKKHYYTLHELAALAGVSVRTIQNHVNAGNLTPLYRGTIFDPKEAEEFAKTLPPPEKRRGPKTK